MVFTTGTNPDFGLKALVVGGDWLVKSHGGESQQFHYTGLEDPTHSPNLSGPNNLGDDAQVFLEALVATGRPAEDFLLYIAGIYNSQLAEDYLAGGGANVMRIPLEPDLIADGTAGALIDLARELHGLHWLLVEGATGVDQDAAEAAFAGEDLEELGFALQPGSGGRFRQRPKWVTTDTTRERVAERVADLQEELDDAARAVFGI